MTLEEIAQEVLDYLSSVRGYSENTLTAYFEDYEKLKNFLGAETEIQKITLQDLRFCVGSLSAQKKAVASINRFIASCKTLFAYCRKFQYILINPALELKSLKMPNIFLSGVNCRKNTRNQKAGKASWAQMQKLVQHCVYNGE